MAVIEKVSNVLDGTITLLYYLPNLETRSLLLEGFANVYKSI